jgi:Zn-dependent alcohol dehydrogenase
MKAAVLYEVKRPLVVEEVDLDSAGPGEVKVRLGATAICHSDIHFFDGDVPLRTAGIAGHECAGIVEEIGEDVTSVGPGGPRGTAVMVQISSGEMSDFSPREFIGERMFTGSMLGSTRLQLDVPRYVDIYKAGRLKLDQLVSACYSLDEVNEAVESSKSGAALRNVIVF